MNAPNTSILILASSILLVACNGGGKDKEPPNAAPSMAAQTFSVAEDAVLTGQLTATDPGDTFTFSVSANPSHGALSGFTTAGAFTYTPTPNYSGSDSFGVTVTDSAGQTFTSTVQLTVTVTNDAPSAANDVLTLTSPSDINVLANDTDPENETLTVSIVGASFPAGATVGANGRVSFPVPGSFRGLVRFRYRVTDPAGATSEANALGFVNIPPFKAVYIGPSQQAGVPGDRVYVNDFLSTFTADGGDGTQDVTRVWPSRAGQSLAYELQVATGGTPQRHELFHVNLAQPTTSRTMTGVVNLGMRARNTFFTNDDRYVIYELNDNGASSAIYRFDSQNAGLVLQRLSPAATDLQFANNPRLNVAGTMVYYGGRAPANGLAATYRTLLSTGVTERVSPAWAAANGIIGVGIDFAWPKADDSLVIFHVLEQLFAPDPHYTVQFSNPSTPNMSQLLQFPPPAAVSLDIPLVAPDGLHAVIPSNSGVILARTDAPGTETMIGTVNFNMQRQREVPDRERAMRADSKAAIIISGCGYPAMFPNIPCDVYEVEFATPAAPVRVNSANAAGQDAKFARYSADGERIWFVNGSGASGRLNLVKRGAFGTQVAVSPAGEDIGSYELDPTGNVAVVSVPATPGSASRLLLVNADAPTEVLEIGSSRSSGFYLVNR